MKRRSATNALPVVVLVTKCMVGLRPEIDNNTVQNLR